MNYNFIGEDGRHYSQSNVGPRALKSEWCIQSDINPNWWRNPNYEPHNQYTWACRHAVQYWPSKEKDGFGNSGAKCPGVGEDNCGDGPFDPAYAVTDEQMEEAGEKLRQLLMSMQDAVANG